MKNKLSNGSATPANADQQSSKEREANRKLSTPKVLEFLKRELPNQYGLAEIVGQWVWVEFTPRQKLVATVLWNLGFHWNQRRGVWQHPCGKFNPYAPHPQDPRSKYGSYFAGDQQPA